MSVSIPMELREQFNKGNVVLFCGAGISSSQDGLPNGTQLAQELAQRAGLSHLVNRSLPEIAQGYEILMGHQSLISYVCDRIDNPRYVPSLTHLLIAALPFKRIITTNWDNLLEESFDHQTKPFVKVVRDNDVAFVDEEKTLIIKMHGSIEQKDTIVITGDDYYDVSSRLPETSRLISSYFATKTILFLGFGLNDEDFKHQYQEVVRHLGKHKRRGYAVQIAPDPLTINYWHEKNVEVIDSDASQFLLALSPIEIQASLVSSYGKFSPKETNG